MNTEQTASARPEKSARQPSAYLCPPRTAGNLPARGPACGSFDLMKSIVYADETRDIGLTLYEILAVADLMREAYGKGDLGTLRNHLSLLTSESASLASTLSRILESAEPVTEPQGAACEQFDIVALLQEIAQIARLIVGNKPVKVMDASSPCPVVIFSDRAKIRRILLEIMSNAAKFTCRGRIAVILNKDNDNISLTFTDTGIGMTSEHINAFRASSGQVDDNEVNGLATPGRGLKMVKRLVTLLNGGISVSSKLGEGTIVEIYLPVGPGERMSGSQKMIQQEHSMAIL